MARLPVPYKDLDWGPILNEFLRVALDEDGKLKKGVVGTDQLQDGAVSLAKLNQGSLTLTAADGKNHVVTVGGKRPTHPQDGDIWFDTGDGER